MSCSLQLVTRRVLGQLPAPDVLQTDQRLVTHLAYFVEPLLLLPLVALDSLWFLPRNNGFFPFVISSRLRYLATQLHQVPSLMPPRPALLRHRAIDCIYQPLLPGCSVLSVALHGHMLRLVATLV